MSFRIVACFLLLLTTVVQVNCLGQDFNKGNGIVKKSKSLSDTVRQISSNDSLRIVEIDSIRTSITLDKSVRAVIGSVSTSDQTTELGIDEISSRNIDLDTKVIDQSWPDSSELKSKLNFIHPNFQKLDSLNLNYHVDSTGLKTAVDSYANDVESNLSTKYGVEEVNRNPLENQDYNELVDIKKSVPKPDSISTSIKAHLFDVFKGKEKQIEGDLSKLAKTQIKYRNFADSRFLPKRPPNPLKGKPFVDRLVPSITFQAVSASDFALDIAPSLGYKLNGNVNIGIGGFRRVVFSGWEKPIEAVSVYGVRVNGCFRMIKELYAYSELQYSNESDFVREYFPLRPKSRLVSDYRANLGIKKTFSIIDRINGFGLIMYDLVQIKRFPNSEGSSTRIGFEFSISKKQKTS